MQRIDARTVYPESGWGWDDYQPMLEAFGTIVVQHDDNDYQGDSRVLYDCNGRIGHLIFGWGSCSGCDALQACGNYTELQGLCDELQDDIQWFDTYSEALEWFLGHDWQGDYGYESNRPYIDQAVEYLQRKIEEESEICESDSDVEILFATASAKAVNC